MTLPAQPDLLWAPRFPAFTNVENFRRTINRRHPGLSLRDYHDLHSYSVGNYEFWMDLWCYLGVLYSLPPEKVTTEGTSPETPVWFPGARLNYAENLLRRTDDSIACTVAGESGTVVHYSFRRLRQMVTEMAASMRVNGLVTGDRVAAVVTNSITAIVIALATASIGGVYTSTAPDMGATGVLNRYRQVQPKFFFVETEVLYAGRSIDLTSKASEIIRDLAGHGLQLAVLLPSAQTGRDILLDKLPNSLTLSSFLAQGDGRPLTFEQLPFQHELVILYSSGTTGIPKCIVHSAGGILLQTMKDICFCYGVGHSDTLLQYTTTGWMMWNLMIAGLALGARIVLYDGSPLHPSPSAFLRFINEQDVSILGVSPRFLAEVHRQAIKPLEIAPFECIRTIVSGGAVLTPSLHRWAQMAFGKRTRIMTAMGGTDICSAFVSSVLSQPIYAGEIPCKVLGMKVEVFDPSGNNIEHTGEAGEMVCTRPHPSIPLYFWGDIRGEKFRSSYYETYPGVWHQGDFIILNPITKGVMILGRSDGVLNPRGVRFGSGEIYSILDQFSSVEDSICVGQRRPQDPDERVILFIKMRSGECFTEALVNQIRRAIRTGLSARHVPDLVLQVRDIPYTMNGKKIELAVKQIISGSHLKPNGAVANPEALEEYSKYTRIEEFGLKGKL